MNVEYAKGAGYAALSAGPVFVLVFIVGALITNGIPARDLAVLPFALLFILLFAVPVGAILGTIPIAFGGFVTGRLGQRFPEARRYAAWGSRAPSSPFHSQRSWPALPQSSGPPHSPPRAPSAR